MKDFRENTRAMTGINYHQSSELSEHPAKRLLSLALPLWVVRVGGDDGELRPLHYTHVHKFECDGNPVNVVTRQWTTSDLSHTNVF